MSSCGGAELDVMSIGFLIFENGGEAVCIDERTLGVDEKDDNGWVHCLGWDG